MIDVPVWPALPPWPALIFWSAIVGGLMISGLGLVRRRGWSLHKSTIRIPTGRLSPVAGEIGFSVTELEPPSLPRRASALTEDLSCRFENSRSRRQ